MKKQLDIRVGEDRERVRKRGHIENGTEGRETGQR